MNKPALRVVAANDNVIQLGQAAPALPSFDFAPALASAKAFMLRSGKGFGLGSLRALRYLLFFVLSWVRVPLSMLCMLGVFGGLLGLGLAALLKPEFALMWKLGLFSFVAFAILMAYDMMLVLLDPQQPR